MKKPVSPSATSQASLRLNFRNGQRLGPGKIELLECIARARSISGAARAMGMSYRQAWLLVDDMNRLFAEPVVKTCPGRSQGAGGSELTTFGERVIALFRAAERRTAEAVALQLHELDAALAPLAASQPDRDADAG